MRRKTFGSLAQLRRQYHAVNKAHGIPRKGRPRHTLKRPLSNTEGGRGWVVQHARIIRISGTPWLVVTDEDVDNLHDRVVTHRDDTQVIINLSGTVPHTEADVGSEDSPQLPPRRR